MKKKHAKENGFVRDRERSNRYPDDHVLFERPRT